jgi:hypothetical protein
MAARRHTDGSWRLGALAVALAFLAGWCGAATARADDEAPVLHIPIPSVPALEEECEEPAGPDDEAAEEEQEEEQEQEEGAFEEEPACSLGPGGRTLPPEDCLVRTADTRLLVRGRQDRLLLVVRYTTFAPTDVEIGARLNGGRGSTQALGSARAHFARSGVYRHTRTLGRAEMDRVRAARRLTVTVGAPAAPGHCARYAIHRLTARHSAHGQVAFIQAGQGRAGRDGNRPKRYG